jgi:actin-related protein 8
MLGRHRMEYGGDDMTIFFYDLLRQSSFPYHEMNLSYSYDWMLAEELKERFCTMSEADLAVKTQTFYVRLPGQMTKKYFLKIFDEVMLVTLVSYKLK